MKVITVLALTLGLSSLVQVGAQERKYGMAGCGLGSIVMGADAGFTQVFAATTNGTSGSQTFGITSGTSNCEGASGARSSRAADYATANRQQLETDIARGEGEALAALTSYLDCKDTAKVSNDLKSNYNNIFSGSNEAAADGVLDVLANSGTCSL